MADHDIPDDPFLERRLASLALLPVPERPTIDELAGRSTDDDLFTPGPSSDRDRRRSHRVWLLAGAAAAVLLAVISIAAVVRSQDIGVASGTAGAVAGREFWSTSVTEDGVERTVGPPGAAGSPHVGLSFGIDSLRATATCNTLNGSYTIEGDHLIVGQMGSTSGFCAVPSAEEDAWLRGILMSSPTLVLDGDHLTLTSGTTVIELLDRAVADPDLPLAGTLWTLESVAIGDTVTGVGQTNASFLLTGSDPSSYELRANDGCKDFLGTIEVEGDWFKAMEQWPIEDGCPYVEPEVVTTGFAAFGAGARYEISGSQLTLTNGAQSLTFRGTVTTIAEATTTTTDPSVDTTGAPDQTTGLDAVGALLGPRWELASVVVDGARSTAEPIEGNRQPWLRFGSDAARFAEVVEGGDKCGDFTGDVVVSASTITFEPTRYVRPVGCDQNLTSTDAAMAEVLSGEATYTTDGTTLTIGRSGSSLELRAVDEGR